MARHITEAVRKAVLADIKDGMKVAEASVKHGVTDNTVYAWIRSQADNTGTSAIEVARLRRENQELKELIGLLSLEKKRAEKNTGRA